MAGQDKFCCALCGSGQWRTLRTLEITDIRIIPRQRLCEGCGAIWLTEERLVRVLHRGTTLPSSLVHPPAG